MQSNLQPLRVVQILQEAQVVIRVSSIKEFPRCTKGYACTVAICTDSWALWYTQHCIKWEDLWVTTQMGFSGVCKWEICCF